MAGYIARWFTHSQAVNEFYMMATNLQKPGILRDFSEHGKLREFCVNSWKIIVNKIVLVQSNICVKELLTG